MTTLNDFLQRCEGYRKRRRISPSYLSRLLFNDGKVIGALNRGGNITLARLARADAELQRLEDVFRGPTSPPMQPGPEVG